MGQIVAALDLGTSKSIALIAQKYYSGKLSVMQIETINSKDAIRRGRIYNSDETAEIITNLIWKLNNNPTMQVEQIYVGIGGQSLHTHPFSVKKIVENGKISQQLLDTLKDEANNYKPEFEENLGIISREYYADGQLVSTPVGALASVIEARFQLIVGNPCLKRSLDTIFANEEITVAGYFISPFATAEAVLTAEEKESGCALIEFGEGVTYLSVYKNKNLIYLITLPLGGVAITKDIRCLNVSEEEAEKLKKEYGSAISQPNNGEKIQVNREHNSSMNIDLHQMNLFIEARVDEIVKNVLKHLQDYEDDLNKGIIITGGGALLKDLPQVIKNQTGKEVRLAKAKVSMNQTDTYLSPADSCVVGLAILGKEDCVIVNTIEKKEKEIKSTLINEIVGEVLGKSNESDSNAESKSDVEDEIAPKDPLKELTRTFNKIVKRGKKIVGNMEFALFKEEDFIDDTTNNSENNKNK